MGKWALDAAGAGLLFMSSRRKKPQPYSFPDSFPGTMIAEGVRLPEQLLGEAHPHRVESGDSDNLTSRRGTSSPAVA